MIFQGKIIKVSTLIVLCIGTMAFSQIKSTTHTIEIKNMKFFPAILTVNKGDKVVWVNKDFVQHCITDELKKAWTSKILDPNKSWSKIITKNESYFCNLHKVMKGKIIVK